MKITKIFKRIKCEIMYRQATAKADYAAKKNKGGNLLCPTYGEGQPDDYEPTPLRGFQEDKTGR